MSVNVNVKSPNVTAAADTPQTAPPTPEQVVEQLRALMASIPDVPSLTEREQKVMRRSRRIPDPEIQASINVVGALDKVANAIGRPADECRQLVEVGNRWDAVENELAGALKAISGANLVRKQRVTVIAIQAYAIGQQLARDPENAAVVPHVKEVKRLKALRRRKTSGSGTPPASDSSKG